MVGILGKRKVKTTVFRIITDKLGPETVGWSIGEQGKGVKQYLYNI